MATLLAAIAAWQNGSDEMQKLRRELMGEDSAVEAADSGLPNDAGRTDRDEPPPTDLWPAKCRAERQP